MGRPQRAGELRQRRAVESCDRSVRASLATAESLKTSFSISRAGPGYVPPVLVETPRRASWPLALDGGAGRRTAACWGLATVDAVVDPWRPAPAEDLVDDGGGAGGFWTPALVRGLVADAMATLRLCRGDGPRPYRCALPDVVREAVTAYGWHDARVRLRPTMDQLGRLDDVLGWLFLLDDPQERMALVGVAMGQSLRRVARLIGCSHTQVRILERRAVAAIVAALEG
jgi:hypothetical protein